MNDIEWFEWVLGLNQVIQGLFHKYEFLRILSNTITLDTNVCISKSTLAFVINMIAFDMSWIKWVFIWLEMSIIEIKGGLVQNEFI